MVERVVQGAVEGGDEPRADAAARGGAPGGGQLREDVVDDPREHGLAARIVAVDRHRGQADGVRHLADADPLGAVALEPPPRLGRDPLGGGGGFGRTPHVYSVYLGSRGVPAASPSVGAPRSRAC